MRCMVLGFTSNLAAVLRTLMPPARAALIRSASLSAIGGRPKRLPSRLARPGLVDHARQLAGADVNLRPRVIARRRAAGDLRALARAPLFVRAEDLGVQPVGVFRANSVGVLRKLVGDLVGRPPLAGQVPNHGLEQLAALTLRGAVPDQVVVVRQRLWIGVVEVEPTGSVPAVAH